MPPDLNQSPGPPPPQPLPGRPIPAPVAPKKKRGCFGCLLGCLVVVVLGILLIGGFGYFGYHEMMKKTEGAVAEFKSQGFEEEKSDMITKDTPILGKKLLNSKYMAVVSTDTDADLAIIGFVAIVDGRVHGSLYFRGGVLVIGPQASIDGDVDVDCYTVMVQGYVGGQIKGKYQSLDESERKKTPPAAQQPLSEEETPALEPPGESAQPPPENAAGETEPQKTPQPPPAETPAAPPPTTPAEPPAAPSPEPQPNTPDQQPPADSPAPPPDIQPPPAAEPTPTDPKPVPPAPSPPAPAPPSQ